MPTIRYGSEIVLLHNETKAFLSSPGIPYSHPNSSRQDQVTCHNKIDSKSYWIVKPPDGYPDDYLYGQSVLKNAILRLENRASRKNLHSHSAPSPNGQQEVTCYLAANGGRDLNDNWQLEIEGKEVFETEARFRLIHTMTGFALHSHSNSSHAVYTSGQQEVTGYWDRDHNDIWTVATMFGPVVPPHISSTGKAASWLTVLSIMSSIASISGVTFLFLGVSLKTASFAQLLSTLFSTLLILGFTTLCILLLLGAHRELKLKMWSIAWLWVLWMIGPCIVLAASLYLWELVHFYTSSQLEPLLRDVFGIK